jgi:GntR family negative regulator for fad regulon and positive regulator of fabA
VLFRSLKEDPESYSTFDWQLHHTLTIASGNSVFTLILNGFQNLYTGMGMFYFTLPQARAHSSTWYTGLLKTCLSSEPEKAATLTEKIMKESLQIWQKSVQKEE